MRWNEYILSLCCILHLYTLCVQIRNVKFIVFVWKVENLTTNHLNVFSQKYIMVQCI